MCAFLAGYIRQVPVQCGRLLLSSRNCCEGGLELQVLPYIVLECINIGGNSLGTCLWNLGILIWPVDTLHIKMLLWRWRAVTCNQRSNAPKLKHKRVWPHEFESGKVGRSEGGRGQTQERALTFVSIEGQQKNSCELGEECVLWGAFLLRVGVFGVLCIMLV